MLEAPTGVRVELQREKSSNKIKGVLVHIYIYIYICFCNLLAEAVEYADWTSAEG